MPEEPKIDHQPRPSGQPGAVISPRAAPQATSQPPAPLPEQDPQLTPALPKIPDEPDSPDATAWTAPEFVAHDKPAGWFLGLVVVAVIFAGLIYLVTKDVVSTGVIIIVAAIFGVYGRHQPRQIGYQLDRGGITIGNRFHSYDEFKSFSVKPEGDLVSLTFSPLKRFSPYLTIYYTAQEEEKITSILVARLPYEEARRDAVDSLMRRIRF